MKKVNLYIIIFVIFFGGCTSENYKTIEKDNAIERISSRNVIVTSANINEIDEGITISGRLKQRYATNSRRLPGHIDVAILDPEGTVIYKTKTRYTNKSYLRVNRNFQFEYSIDIPFIPSEGNTIRVTFHEG